MNGWSLSELKGLHPFCKLNWAKLNFAHVFIFPIGPEQTSRPNSHGYVRSPSPSIRPQETILQQRPSIFQGANGKGVITSLDAATQPRIMYVLEQKCWMKQMYCFYWGYIWSKVTVISLLCLFTSLLQFISSYSHIWPRASLTQSSCGLLNLCWLWPNSDSSIYPPAMYFGHPPHSSLKPSLTILWDPHHSFKSLH